MMLKRLNWRLALSMSQITSTVLQSKRFSVVDRTQAGGVTQVTRHTHLPDKISQEEMTNLAFFRPLENLPD